MLINTAGKTVRQKTAALISLPVERVLGKALDLVLGYYYLTLLFELSDKVPRLALLFSWEISIPHRGIVYI